MAPWTLHPHLASSEMTPLSSLQRFSKLRPWKSWEISRVTWHTAFCFSVKSGSKPSCSPCLLNEEHRNTHTSIFLKPASTQYSNWLRGSKAKASTVSRPELIITSCPVLPFKQRRWGEKAAINTVKCAVDSGQSASPTASNPTFG